VNPSLFISLSEYGDMKPWTGEWRVFIEIPAARNGGALCITYLTQLRSSLEKSSGTIPSIFIYRSHPTVTPKVALLPGQQSLVK
jgi:hypothetical protein